MRPNESSDWKKLMKTFSLIAVLSAVLAPQFSNACMISDYQKHARGSVQGTEVFGSTGTKHGYFQGHSVYHVGGRYLGMAADSRTVNNMILGSSGTNVGSVYGNTGEIMNAGRYVVGYGTGCSSMQLTAAALILF